MLHWRFRCCTMSKPHSNTVACFQSSNPTPENKQYLLSSPSHKATDRGRICCLHLLISIIKMHISMYTLLLSPLKSPHIKAHSRREQMVTFLGNLPVRTENSNSVKCYKRERFSQSVVLLVGIEEACGATNGRKSTRRDETTTEADTTAPLPHPSTSIESEITPLKSKFPYKNDLMPRAG